MNATQTSRPRSAAPNSPPPVKAAAVLTPQDGPGPGHLSHLTDIEKAAYVAAVAEALAAFDTLEPDEL